MKLPGGRAAKVGLALAILVAGLASAGALAVATGAVSRPAVEDASTDWGRVTDESTVIETTVAVDNPNSIGVPPVAGVGYGVAMNGVTVARADRDRVGLPSGTSTVTVTTRMDNAKLPDWWASHVNNDETTTVTVRPTVFAGGVSHDLSARTRTFSTDVLAAFESDEKRRIAVAGQPVLVVTDTEAHWGRATAESAPLTVAVTVHNPRDVPVTLPGLGYALSMNGIPMAEGAADDVTIRPGETATVRIEGAFDSERIDDWWTSHVRHGETTALVVDAYAEASVAGETVRIPLDALGRTYRLETTILEGGDARIEPVETPDRGLDLERPTLTSTSAEWTVDDGTAAIRARAVVHDPNGADAPLADALRLDVGYAVDMNGVTLAEGATEDVALDPGENVVTVDASAPREQFRRWWASHVNAGERTTVTVRPSVTADVGLTTIAVPVDPQRRTFTTDLLGDMNTTEDRVVTLGGRPALVVTERRAWWGTATAETTPLHTAFVVSNPTPLPVVVDDIGYTITLNDVVVADGTRGEPVQLAPGATETIAVDPRIDNAKLGEWWVTHLENGERSQLDVSYFLVTEVDGETRRIPIEGLGYSTTVETDTLGNGD